jgi:hypothetical protein
MKRPSPTPSARRLGRVECQEPPRSHGSTSKRPRRGPGSSPSRSLGSWPVVNCPQPESRAGVCSGVPKAARCHCCLRSYTACPVEHCRRRSRQARDSAGRQRGGLRPASSVTDTRAVPIGTAWTHQTLHNRRLCITLHRHERAITRRFMLTRFRRTPHLPASCRWTLTASTR